MNLGRIALCAIAALATTASSLFGAGIPSDPPLHPNHYVVLVDASGSNVATPAREEAYRYALGTVTEAGLWRQGFGPLVPVCDPHRDYLSIYHFGIVTDGGENNAYDRLSKGRFADAFLHPVCYWHRGGPDAPTGRSLVPHTYFDLTLLALAKPLALWAARALRPELPCNRWFMIVVTDAIPNEATLAEETAQALRFMGSANAAEVEGARKKAEHGYAFTDGQGGRGWVWQRLVQPTDGSTPIFVEAYEVVALERAHKETDALREQPFLRLVPTWSQVRGRQTASVAVTLSPEFLRWSRGLGATSGEFMVVAGGGVSRVVWNGQSSLDVALPLDDHLSEAPLPGSASLSLRWRDADEWLGSREQVHEWRSPLAVPQPPPQVPRWAWIVAALICGLLVAWPAYLLLWARTLRISYPGSACAPMGIGRTGQVLLKVPVAPCTEVRAFSLHLPPVRYQRAFLARARLEITTQADVAVRWSGARAPGLTVRLPQPAERLTAVWERTSQAAPQVCLAVKHLLYRGLLVLCYRAPMEGNGMHEVWVNPDATNIPTNCWVSLDLGSESMASYYHYAWETLEEKGMANLQHHAGVNPADPSPRLPTRIGMREQLLNQPLNEDHACLDLVGEGAESSLFAFFDRSLAGRSLMPNPKILFALNNPRLLPQPAGQRNGESAVSPETLINHLITQVVRNFVLRSPELQGLPAVSPLSIHLVLTVPNVYSLEHVTAIREFGTRFLGVGRLQIVYESDAIAYYSTEGDSKEPTAVSFRELISRRTTEESQPIYIATMDVGRGTTDLSLIHLAPPTAGGQVEHTICARTGTSDGGNALTYILAHYYNQRFLDVFSILSRLLNEFALDRPEASPPLAPPFDFLSFRPGFFSHGEQQGRAASVLEQLILAIKSEMSEEFTICTDDGEQARLIGEISSMAWEGIGGTAFANTYGLEEGAMRQLLQEALIAAMTLPCGRKLVRTDNQSPPLLNALSSIFRTFSRWLSEPTPKPPVADAPDQQPELPPTVETERAPSLVELPILQVAREKAISELEPTRQHLDALGEEIKEYVRSNAEVPLLHLFEMAEAWSKGHGQGGTTDHPRNPGAPGPNDLFIIIAGRASQFKPLRAHIKSWFRKQFRLSDGHLLDLEADEAKEACCRGALAFALTNPYVTNPMDIHGTYWLRPLGQGLFRETPAFRTAVLNQGEADKIARLQDIQYVLAFMARHFASEQSQAPAGDAEREQVHEDDGSIIGLLQRASEYEARYDTDAAALYVNGERMRLGGHGGARDLREVLKKAWPEVLQPSRTAAS